MTNIQVQLKEDQVQSYTFEVTCADDGGQTTHSVTLDKSNYITWTDRKIKPEIWVEKSFEFLLEREPKESILRRFNMTVILEYFPEYVREMKQLCRSN